MTKTNMGFIAIVALVIGLLTGVFGFQSKSGNLGGTTYDVSHLIGDVRQGLNDALIASNGIVTGVLGGSANATYPISTSTVLSGAFDCQYDTINQTTSTAQITLTLASATLSSAQCLTQDGAQEMLFVKIAPGNAFGMLIATSTGDILTWNATATGGALLGTSTAGSYYKIEAVRYSSSSIVYTIGNMGSAH